MSSIRKWIASKMFPPLTANGGESSEANTSENGFSFIRSLSRNITSTIGVQDGILADCVHENEDDAARSTYFSIIYQHYESLRSKHLALNEKQLVAEMYQFYYANEELNYVSSELDTFDGRKDTDRCSVLVNSLKLAQDRVIGLIFRIMDLVGCERASRDYRLKFPDELLVGEGTESLNSQIWFAAECLAAGSTITNNQAESNYLRPIANNLTTTLDNIRFEIRNYTNYLPKVPKLSREFVGRLEDFDRLFVSFEYDYVKAMLPIKSSIDIESLQELTFLFSDTLAYAIHKGLITKQDVDECEPNVMIALPRLSIVRGLLQGYGSVVCKQDYDQLCSILRPYHSLLLRFHELLATLDEDELEFLEQLLATNHHNLEKASELINRKAEAKTKESAPKMGKRRMNGMLKNKYLSASVDLLMVYNKCENYDKSHPNRTSRFMDERFRSLPNIILTRVDFLDKHTIQVSKPTTKTSTTSDNKQHQIATSDASPSTTSSLPVSSSSNETYLSSSSSISSSSSSNSIFYMQTDTERRGVAKRCQSATTSSGNAANRASGKHKQTRPKSNIDPQAGGAQANATSRRAVTTTPGRNHDGNSETPLTLFFSDNSLHLDLESIYFDEVAQYKLGQKRILHQFFVMISKIADKFQTNYASELRNILRTVFYFHELAEKEELERQMGVNNKNKTCLLAPVNVRLGYYSNDLDGDGYRSHYDVEEGIDANELLLDLIGDRIEDVVPSTSSQSSQQQHHRDNCVPPCTCDNNTKRRRRSFEQLLSSEASRILARSTSTPNTLVGARNRSNFAFPRNRGHRKSKSLPSNLNISNETCQLAQQQQQSCCSSKSLDDSSSLSSTGSLQHSQFTNSTGTTLDDAGTDSCDLPTFIYPCPGDQSNDGNVGAGPAMLPIIAGATRSLLLPPVWVPDELESMCTACAQVFSLLRRRHHCRRCGHIFCHQCSNNFVSLRCFGYAKPVRVCNHCLGQHEQTLSEQYRQQQQPL